MKSKILNNESLKAGDIVLCYSSIMLEEIDGIKYGYSHVAICVNEEEILESVAAGVKKTNINNLLNEYNHVAVLRGEDLWSNDRIAKLNQYAGESIGKPFNADGLKMYRVIKEEYKEAAMERVHGYFEKIVVPSSGDNNKYFCSELVTSAFIKVGIIHESAAIIFAPETFLPEDIGQDKVFGFFIGYIIPYDDYKIPENDYFQYSI